MNKTYVRKSKYGYRGYFAVYGDNNKKIWSESAGIDRITKEDAQDDADKLKKDREATWEEK